MEQEKKNLTNEEVERILEEHRRKEYSSNTVSDHGDDTKGYLYCENTDISDGCSAEELFITQKTPENLIEKYEEMDNEVDRIQSIHQLPRILSIVKWIAFAVAIVVVFGVFRSDVSLAQGYHNSPALFWIGGCALIVLGVLFLYERFLRHQMSTNEDVDSAMKRLNDAESKIREYMSVPENAIETDILGFSYSGKKDHLHLHGAASYFEMLLFRQGKDVCLFDGLNVLTFPKEEMVGIRVVDHGIPVENWNKSESASQDQYKKCGVISREDNPIGLRFYCSLDIIHSGETYSLLFPAYELTTIAGITGLPAPELPPKMTIDKSMKKLFINQIQNKDKVRPVFYWKPPEKEDVKFWFTPLSDAEFQMRHPVLYVFFVIIGIAALMLPATLFYFVICNIFGAEINKEAILGLLGGVVMGIGLFNIVAAWLHQYLGHVLTIICFSVGIVMMAVSCFLIL